MTPYLVSKIFICWLCVVYATLAGIIYGFPASVDTPFFQYGPNKNFKVLGIHIDTYPKYSIIVAYCFVNSIFRTLHRNYLHPWVLNSVQDEKSDKRDLVKKEVFLVVSIGVLYHWTDWLLYMNILLSQIDMLVIEVVADLGMSYITTYYYLRSPQETCDTFDVSYIAYKPSADISCDD